MALDPISAGVGEPVTPRPSSRLFRRAAQAFSRVQSLADMGPKALAYMFDMLFSKGAERRREVRTDRFRARGWKRSLRAAGKRSRLDRARNRRITKGGHRRAA